MYIAVVQNNPKLGALKDNVAAALASIDVLAESAYPPDLVIFPAYAITGTPIKGLQYSDSFAAESLEAAQQMLEKAKLPTLIGTMIPRPMPEELAFICEAEVLYCKDGKGSALGFVDVGSSWDADSYASSITIPIDGHEVSILLDEYPDVDDDFTDSEVVILMLAKEFEGTKTMFTASDQLGYLRSFARKNAVWVIVVNLVGASDAHVYDGASIILKPDGSIARAIEPFKEGLITCNINLTRRAHRSLDAREQIYNDDCLVRPLLPYEAEWKAIELFIRDYIHKNGFTDVVLGLSGGLDSAVCAVLACDALGAEHVHGVMMPSPYSSQGSIDDSLALAEKLGIETRIIPIDEALAAFRPVPKKVAGEKGVSIADQNIQNRIRMTNLMYLSNCFDWLMLNTSNKSELAMGYSTLYGDTAGAIAPLGNIYKTGVFGLAHWRNEQSPVIPQSILTKPPSAELYVDQKDEDSLPPYEVLDHVLRLHIEEGLGVDQILNCAIRDLGGESLTSELIEGILNSVRIAEHKRRQGSLSPTLGYVDMSHDRDWPITNGFVDHHRTLVLDDRLTNYLGMINSWKQPGGWSFLAN